MMREIDPMLDVFIFESSQLLESLEEILLQSEKTKELTSEHIGEIFRIMHTIKGSSSMMSLDELAKLSHALEDMFDKIREGKTRTDADALEGVIELVLASSDYIKVEIEKLSNGLEANGEFSELNNKIHKYLETIMGNGPPPEIAVAVEDDLTVGFSDDGQTEIDVDTPIFKVIANFEDGCLMENLRAFGLVTALSASCHRILHKPADLEAEESSD